MSRKTLPVLSLALFILVVSVPSAFADGPPTWLTQAATVQTPTFEIKDVPAVVLLNDERVTVAGDGTVLRTARYAVRILIREGRDEAVARAIYTTGTERVRSIAAWLIPKGGVPKSYGKKETVDAILSANDLYNEARVTYINAEDDADTGDVFGYETVVEEKNIFSQFQFSFQDNLPAVVSRFALDLPAGWKAESVMLNAQKIEPSVNGTSSTWELRDLKPIKPEPNSPSFYSLAPRLAVSFYPTTPTATQIKTFANWNDVAKWMSQIEDPQMTVNDAIAAKTQELTAGAKTEFEKVQAISRYVQQLQYISIQIGTGRGGGYIPHAATEVFAKSYGDCKDKANLMRAMLSIVKIQSYMVSITADDPQFVRPEWASPHQFNHCIIAIKIADATIANSVVTHPKLGRLLIFDATDPYTPLGDLPEEEQGSWALIDHVDTDALIQMPVMPAETNRLDRKVEVALGIDGSINGTLVESTIGQKARGERSMLRRMSSPDYNRMVEGWIGRGASGAKATKITPSDDVSGGKFNLNVEFAAPGYAQIMQERLMVFKPAIIGRLDRLSFTEGKRFHPFMIDATSYTENVKIKLPPGFAVDEMPEPTKIEMPFGKYDATYEVKEDHILFSRTLKLNRYTVPAENYSIIRDFFGKLHAAEQSPVVLIRK
jgi:hypothetical protein